MDDDRRIRVAILDTGIDSTHQMFHEALQGPEESRPIVAWKGFPSSLDPLRDMNGHGTHATSVLHKVAPDAALYIARVANDKGQVGENGDYGHVVDVLTHAA